MLADALRATSDVQLAALLLARRDLATPPPADTDVLARRAGSTGSVARACEQLNARELATVEALLLLDADHTPASRPEVDRLLGVDATWALAALERLALCWPSGDGVSLVAAAREVLGPFPAGLGRSVPALADTDLAAVVAELSESERSLLGKLAAGPPIGRSRDAAVDVDLDAAITPVQRLLARGLLVRRDTETVELPRELGLHLRGGQAFATLHEPELRTNRHAQESVDRAAAGEAMELCRHAGALLAAWSAAPPPVLKSGGLGVREIRRICRDVEVDEPRAVLLAELLVAAGLVADSASTSPEFVPTTLADSWLATGPAGRWAVLAAAWLDLPRLPGLAYARPTPSAPPSVAKDPITASSAAKDPITASDKPPAPLSDRLHRPTAPSVRRRVLGALADLPPGTGVADAAQLVAVLAWRAPRRGGRLRDETARWVLSEAAAMGVTAMGAVPTATRALLTDPEPGESGEDPRRRAAVAMAEALPAPVDHVLVQADLTVVAPGPLEAHLADEIAAVADIESAGHATVYRVSEQSVRRALDGGRTAAELHALFAEHSRTPVPQSLTYLIDDVARRHGRLRGGAAASFLRADDEVLVAEVLAHPAAGELELRRIAPTVLVSPLPLAQVLDGLRAGGFAPAAEGVDGQVVELAPRGRRVAAPRGGARRVRSTAGQLDAEQAAAVVARIRAGDAAAGARRGNGVRNAAGTGDTSATLELLATAARAGRKVWIGYVDANGTAAQRLVTPVRVSAGILNGADDDRYPLHRITSAAYVE